MGQCKIQMEHEDIIKFIKSQRLGWAAHVKNGEHKNYQKNNRMDAI